MASFLRRMFLASVAASASLVMGCGAVCGDGALDAGEACDDTNNADGDGCDAVCAFEAPKTDYRLSQIALDDGRFALTNILLGDAIGNDDLEVALNLLIQFDNTEEAAANVTFGPGAFLGGTEFAFDETLAPPALVTVTNTDGAISFDAPVDVTLPIEAEIGSGVFLQLPIREALVAATFDKQQLGGEGSGGLFVDKLEDGTITAKVNVFDLCSLNIDLDADPLVDEFVNLLDIFDDGLPTLGGAAPSSVTPPPGTPLDQIDDTNCVPCGGPGAPDNCVLPEDAANNQYNVGALFEAEGNITISL